MGAFTALHWLLWHGGGGLLQNLWMFVYFKKQLLFSIYLKLHHFNTVHFLEGQPVCHQTGARWVLLFLFSLTLQMTPPCCSTTFTWVWKAAHAHYVQSFCTTLILLPSGFPLSLTFALLFFHPCPLALPSIVLTSTWHVGYIHASKTSQDIPTRPFCMSPGHLFIINLLCGCWGPDRQLVIFDYSPVISNSSS